MKYLKLFEDFNREGKVDVNEINNIITDVAKKFLSENKEILDNLNKDDFSKLKDRDLLHKIESDIKPIFKNLVDKSTNPSERSLNENIFSNFGDFEELSEKLSQIIEDKFALDPDYRKYENRTKSINRLITGVYTLALIALSASAIGLSIWAIQNQSTLFLMVISIVTSLIWGNKVRKGIKKRKFNKSTSNWISGVKSKLKDMYQSGNVSFSFLNGVEKDLNDILSNRIYTKQAVKNDEISKKIISLKNSLSKGIDNNDLNPIPLKDLGLSEDKENKLIAYYDMWLNQGLLDYEGYLDNAKELLSDDIDVDIIPKIEIDKNYINNDLDNDLDNEGKIKIDFKSTKTGETIKKAIKELDIIERFFD